MVIKVIPIPPFEQLRRKGYKFHNEQNRDKVRLNDGTNVYNNQRHIKRIYKIKDVYGYDTETYKGKCKLICRSNGTNDSLYFDNDDLYGYIIKRPKSNQFPFMKILNFLFYQANNSHVWRFFYNIDFDYNAIIKTLNLDNPYTKIMVNMLDNGYEVQFGKYILHYIKGIMFTIRDISRKKKVVFTDLYRVFKISLNSASIQFLKNEQKDIIESERLNTDIDYWINNLPDIIKYCIQDCKLLKKLGVEFLHNLKKAKISIPRYLCSPASLSKQHFRKKCAIPKLLTHIPLEVLQISYDCYYGGRFEMLKRGTFNQMYNYDVNSEYSEIIADLPSFKYGLWLYYNKNHKNFDTTYIKNDKEVFKFQDLKNNKIPKYQCYGYFKAKLKIPDENLISTIPIREGIIRFLNGVFEKWFTWYDLDLMREYIIEIQEAYIYSPSKREYKVFYDTIQYLYKQKLKYKKTNKVMYLIFKLVMNALYGCFFEIHKEKVIAHKTIRNTGVLFNPVYASQITAFGRWKILKDVWTIKDKLIAFHTDSIISEIPLDDYLDIGSGLGQWNLECYGKGYIINTGMYQINGKEKLIKTRGIPKKYIKDWFKFAKDNKHLSYKEFEIKRMVKIGQSIRQFKDLDMVNIMNDNKKTVNINSDKKRHWFYKFDNFKATLEGNIESLPYIYAFDKLLPNPICI